MGEQTVVVEHDGFELTQEFGEVVAYRLVDLDTGDLVAEESVDLRTTPIGETGPVPPVSIVTLMTFAMGTWSICFLYFSSHGALFSKYWA